MALKNATTQIIIFFFFKMNTCYKMLRKSVFLFSSSKKYIFPATLLIFIIILYLTMESFKTYNSREKDATNPEIHRPDEGNINILPVLSTTMLCFMEIFLGVF